jgi:hypothetical protein
LNIFNFDQKLKKSKIKMSFQQDRAFTGIKDVDLKILFELDDRSLLNACATNKYAYNICKNESFWRDRFISRFGNEVTKYKPEERSWKNHYMQVIIDLSLFSKNPMNFLKHIVWRGSIEDSYFEPETNPNKTYKHYIPLLQAPEWVITNLYLLDLGKKIKLRSSLFYESKVFFHPTPIQLLNFIFAAGYSQIRGFNLREDDTYGPLSVRYKGF